MTASEAVGSVIDALLERRYGAQFSPKWWRRRHDYLHSRMTELACPYCPSPAELGRLLVEGGALCVSYNDAVAAFRAFEAEATSGHSLSDSLAPSEPVSE